jgi:hypothetical protein
LSREFVKFWLGQSVPSIVPTLAGHAINLVSALPSIFSVLRNLRSVPELALEGSPTG